ncbi:MAG: sugar phosphorylase [Balneolaceae bacterium]
MFKKETFKSFAKMAYPRFTKEIEDRLTKHFTFIYGKEKLSFCLDETHKLLEKYGLGPVNEREDFKKVWTHKDQILITYGDMVKPEPKESISKLRKLQQFLNEHVKYWISTIHILPFYPSSSDDGFSVVDYMKVNASLGGWDNIEELSRDFRLMGDLVMNHTSRHSSWFKSYLKHEEPYNDFFIEVDPETDLSAVTRARSSPLLTPVHAESGEKFVWSTFSEDQIDVKFSNPVLLFRFLNIFLFYIKEGLSVIRLDAVAFIWKKLGTTCIHLPETHEIVKLFRTIVDFYAPKTTIITETNVPHKENISYFGDGDEAHMVYQFSLPPLLLHAILTENAQYLTTWAQSLKKLPENCTYFNFTSSHDGIGVRPLEGLVPLSEFTALVKGMERRGGFVSEKKNPDGTFSPYELNITYFDAFSDYNGSQSLQERRYICSQIIMLSLRGVPGIYFHNLMATRNNVKGVSVTGRYRTINRKKWTYEELTDSLNDPDTNTYRIFHQYKEIIKKRNLHSAFHPFGNQKVLAVDNDVFCLERTAIDETEKVLVLANVTGKKLTVDAEFNDLPLDSSTKYSDILSDKVCVTNGVVSLAPYQVVWIML